MAQALAVSDLRAWLGAHGYNVFLTPDRPSGWWVTMRNATTGTHPPIEARAASRADALALAARLFVNHRLQELDAAIRDAGLTPPPWSTDDQVQRLASLLGFAHAHGLS